MSTKQLCQTCKHYNGDFTCKAFGERTIPDEIFRGDNDHEQPIALQENDITYEPTKDAQNLWKELDQAAGLPDEFDEN